MISLTLDTTFVKKVTKTEVWRSWSHVLDESLWKRWAEYEWTCIMQNKWWISISHVISNDFYCLQFV